MGQAFRYHASRPAARHGSVAGGAAAALAMQRPTARPSPRAARSSISAGSMPAPARSALFRRRTTMAWLVNEALKDGIEIDGKKYAVQHHPQGYAVRSVERLEGLEGTHFVRWRRHRDDIPRRRRRSTRSPILRGCGYAPASRPSRPGRRSITAVAPSRANRRPTSGPSTSPSVPTTCGGSMPTNVQGRDQQEGRPVAAERRRRQCDPRRDDPRRCRRPASRSPMPGPYENGVTDFSAQIATLKTPASRS